MNRSPVFIDLIYAQYFQHCSQYKFWKNPNNRLTVPMYNVSESGKVFAHL